MRIPFFRRKKSDEPESNKYRSGEKNYLSVLYNIYQNMPVVRNLFAAIRNLVEMEYPGDSISINKKTLAIMNKRVLYCAAGILISLFFSGGSIYILALGSLLTMYLTTRKVKATRTELTMELQSQLMQAIDELVNVYDDTPAIDIALLKIRDRLPNEIRLHMDMMYDILTAYGEISLKAQTYKSNINNPYLQLFLELCQSTKKLGNKKSATGNWLLVDRMLALKQDIGEDISRLRYRTKKFDGFTFSTVLPIVIAKLIEAILSFAMADFKDLFQSAYGNIYMTVLFVATMVICYLIDFLEFSGDVTEKKTKTIFSEIAKIPVISKFCNGKIEKEYKKYRDYETSMKALGDYTGARALIAKQIVSAFLAFVVCIALGIYADVKEKIDIDYSLSEEFADDSTIKERMIPDMREASKIYYNKYKGHSAETIDYDQLVNEIRNNTAVVNKTYAEKVADSVIARVERKNKAYFKFYFVLIALIAAFYAYRAPEKVLEFKEKTIESKMASEVMRYQSLMLILMSMSGMTLPLILEMLENFSGCFRDDIIDCRLMISRNKDKALEKLCNVNYRPMAIFCNKFKMIDTYGVEKAFRSLEIDRDYNKRNYLENEYDIIDNNASIGRNLNRKTLAIMFVTSMLIPMIVVIVNVFKEVAPYL